MEGFRVLEIKKSVFENNDREADKLRQELKKEKTFLLNLMSSPGYSLHLSRSKSKYGITSILLTRSTSQIENISGYLRGLS